MLQQRTLPPDPASAMAARRFAQSVLRDWREGDAADVVALLVSELVTNAVLHAGSRVEVCMRRRGPWLRVEVADESPVLPGQREFDDEATTGRGLCLVEVLADAWGVEPRGDHGKAVWFEVPASNGTEGEGDAEPRDSGAVSVCDDEVVIRLRNAPVQLFPAAHQHTEALLREFALMAMEMGADISPPRLVLDMRAVSEQTRAAVDAGRSSVDLVVAAPASAHDDVAEAFDALDVADRLAADGRLLSAPALPEIRWVREWFLSEVIAQLEGREPTPWTMAAIRTDTQSPLTVDHRAALDALESAVVVADDQNRISYVNEATEALLGWERGTLTGQRLTVLVPDRLKEAHLAGYTRYQMTRQPRLLGTPVRVPARRRDGSEIDIDLTLSATTSSEGRQMFVANLRPVGDEEATVPPAEGYLSLLDGLARCLGENGSDTQPADVLALLGETLGWSVGNWWVVDGDQLRYLTTWMDQPDRFTGFEAATADRRLLPGEGLPGRVWDEGRAVWVPDVVRDANSPRMSVALSHGLRTACAFPVTAGQRTTGVIELFSERVLDGDEALVAALQTSGRIVGAMLDAPSSTIRLPR